MTEQEEFEFRARLEAEQSSAPKAAPLAPSGPTGGNVLWNAANKGIAGTIDTVANFGPQLSNLGRTLYGKAMGQEPSYIPPPDYAKQAMTAMGAIRPEHEPQGTGQKVLDVVTQGVVGGLMFPGGGAAPAVGGAASAMVRNAGKLVPNLMKPGLTGAENILTKYQKAIIGPERQKVIDALAQAKEVVPGSKPTAAEAVAHLPEGSPLQAHQTITAKTPGGISGQFGQRVADQIEARKAAQVARDANTGPLREAALAQANAGGVESGKILSQIEQMQGVPGQRASDMVSKTLGSVKEKLQALTNEYGTIDAKDLYTIRKEVGNIIQTHAKDTANWDKKLSAGLQRDVQQSIDAAIEAAGGTGWKDYLASFSKQSQAIADDLARKKLSLKPAQRTQLEGGTNIGEETRAHLPNMLNRPMMLTNAVLKRLGGGIESKIDTVAADRYLNPQKLADALKDVPPYERYQIVDALLKQAPGIGQSLRASQEGH